MVQAIRLTREHQMQKVKMLEQVIQRWTHRKQIYEAGRTYEIDDETAARFVKRGQAEPVIDWPRPSIETATSRTGETADRGAAQKPRPTAGPETSGSKRRRPRRNKPGIDRV